jgi:hypothetical protein
MHYNVTNLTDALSCEIQRDTLVDILAMITLVFFSATFSSQSQTVRRGLLFLYYFKEGKIKVLA